MVSVSVQWSRDVGEDGEDCEFKYPDHRCRESQFVAGTFGRHFIKSGGLLILEICQGFGQNTREPLNHIREFCSFDAPQRSWELGKWSTPAFHCLHPIVR